MSDHEFIGAVNVKGEPVVAVRLDTDTVPGATGQPCRECGNLEDAHQAEPKPVRKPRGDR